MADPAGERAAMNAMCLGRNSLLKDGGMGVAVWSDEGITAKEKGGSWGKPQKWVWKFGVVLGRGNKRFVSVKKCDGATLFWERTPRRKIFEVESGGKISGRRGGEG